jgi:hypothetical protein
MALGGMVAGGVITQADADKLLAIAVEPDPVTHTQVGAALAGEAT